MLLNNFLELGFNVLLVQLYSLDFHSVLIASYIGLFPQIKDLLIKLVQPPLALIVHASLPLLSLFQGQLQIHGFLFFSNDVHFNVLQLVG